MNVAVIQGRVGKPPEERTLPSGDRIVQLEVAVRRIGHPGESVPVAWPNPPPNAGQLEPGTELLVLGRVRRRFFRAGGFTQSRTEVVAEKVVPVKHPKKVADVLGTAHDRLDGKEERP